jgi:hypothetical protein
VTSSAPHQAWINVDATCGQKAQTTDHSLLVLLKLLPKVIQQVGDNLAVADISNYETTKCPPPGCLRENLLEIHQPPDDGLPIDAKQRANPATPVAIRLSLSKGCHQQDYAVPVDPPAHEENRWRLTPTSTSLSAAAQTAANPQPVRHFDNLAPGLTLV